MVLKGILVLFAIIEFLYSRFTTYLIWKQRTKPLPKCVAHIYEQEDYDRFLAYRKEYKRINLITDFISLMVTCVLVLSNFYTFFDISNPYIGFLRVYLFMLVLDIVTDLPLEYYATFYIEEKYGMNHKIKKEFFKDVLIEKITSLVAINILLFVLIYLCEHVSIWTNGFSISYSESLFFCLMLVGGLIVIVLLISLLSLIALRIQYTFIEMEECPLKQQIQEYCKESKKKVHHIKIYNESKKSNSKNAFLLKIFGYREFGIADNFMDENSEDELLAVLLHEIGHLKHKKDIWDYLCISVSLALFSLFVVLIPNAKIIVEINGWINESFHMNHTNYYLSFIVFMTLLSPFGQLYTVLKNYVSSKHEKEADFNAVDKGYGQALIQTFSKLSNDELIDVNPHPFVEFTEYDHPGMARRIQDIESRINKKN